MPRQCERPQGRDTSPLAGLGVVPRRAPYEPLRSALGQHHRSERLARPAAALEADPADDGDRRQHRPDESRQHQAELEYGRGSLHRGIHRPLSANLDRFGFFSARGCSRPTVDTRFRVREHDHSRTPARSRIHRAVSAQVPTTPDPACCDNPNGWLVRTGPARCACVGSESSLDRCRLGARPARVRPPHRRVPSAAAAVGSSDSQPASSRSSAVHGVTSQRLATLVTLTPLARVRRETSARRLPPPRTDA